MTTKDKILKESKAYLNAHGYGASSLYQVAQRIGISRGNLTYHIKDKEALLDLHLVELRHIHDQALVKSVSIPSWKSLHAATTRFHEIQKDYAFIFFDKSVLSLPKVNTLIKSLRQENIRTQMSMINLSIQIGNMRPESINGVYHNISRIYWTISYSWLIERRFIEANEVSWDQLMWSMLLPHFTDKGLASFREHFGEDYVEALGMRFDTYMSGLPSF